MTRHEPASPRPVPILDPSFNPVIPAPTMNPREGACPVRPSSERSMFESGREPQRFHYREAA